MKLLGYFCIAFMSCFWITTIHAQQKKTLPPHLDRYINQVLDSFQVPGVAVAIVKDGQVMLAKGYGIKKMGEAAKVDAHTLFLIASNSKAFTATALALLVEEGKIQWDDPVVKYLPWFRMSDPYVTTHLTIRDMLVHHSGLPAYAGDLMLFPPADFSRREVLDKLADIPLRYEFRTTYAYDNILYVAAGELIKAVSGMEWEDFVQTRIFDKVGMKESISRFSLLSQQPNFAWAHARLQDSVRVAEGFMDQDIGDVGDPAGGIAASATDMAQWLITQLDSGRTASGQELFHPAATRELWKVITPMPVSKVPESLKPAQQDFWGYGLGFRTYNYGKYKMVGHGGALKGFVSQIAMVPSLNLGVVVLTNQHSAGAYWSVIYHILDYYMDNPSFDWLSGYKSQEDSGIAQSIARSRKLAIEPVTPAPPPLPLEKFTGVYEEPLLGRVLVDQEPGGLVLRFDHSTQMVADLVYYRYNSFIATFRYMDFTAQAFLTFTVNPDGSMAGATLKPIDPASQLDFGALTLKAVPKKITDTAQLRAALTRAFATHPEGVFAVALKDLSTGNTFELNAHESFHAASTMKTPVLIETYKQAAAGKFSIQDSVIVKNKFVSILDGSYFSIDSINDSEHDLYLHVGEKLPVYNLLFRMITQSSNLATDNIVDLVGAQNVMATMKSIGANDIQVLRGVEDIKAYEAGMNNTTTAHDLMLVFEQLGNASIVDQAACEAMLDILSHQHFRNIIPGQLPYYVKTATKTGSIVAVCHDSGIVYLPDGRKYVLVLLSKGIASDKEATHFLAGISKMIYDYIQ